MCDKVFCWYALVGGCGKLGRPVGELDCKGGGGGILLLIEP